jgi:hypothetical protein
MDIEDIAFNHGFEVVAIEISEFNATVADHAKSVFKKHGHMLLIDTLFAMHQESGTVFNEKFSRYLFKYTKMAIVYVSSNAKRETDLMQGSADAVEAFKLGVESIVRLPQSGSGGPYVLCFSSDDANARSSDVEQNIIEAVLKSFVLMKYVYEYSRLSQIIDTVYGIPNS